MKMLLRFIAFLFLLTISLGLVLVTITATETGSQWFIHWLIKTNDIPLTIESIEGRLLDKLTLSELHYSDPELNDISLGRLEFDWSVADLIQFEANVKKLALFDLVVRSQPEKKTDESFSFPTLAIPDLPVSLTIEALNLDKASIFSDDSEIKIQDFKSNLTLSSGKLTYKLEQLLVDEQHFNGSVHLIADVKPVLEVGIGWSGTINEKPGTGRLHLKGAQDDLAIDVSIDSAIELLLEGKLNLNAKTIAGELNGAIKGELFDSFSETAVLDSPLNLHIKGDMQHLSMQLDADAHTPAGEAFSFHFNTEAVLPESTATALNVNINWATISESDNPLLTLKGQGDFSLLDQILTIDHDLHMPDRINTSGKINLANNEIDMATDWEALVLSLSETSSLHLNAGLLKAAGKLDALSLLVQTQYALETKPETNSENESSEVDYASLSVKGQLNLLTAHPTGQLTGNINSPVPSVLANKLEAIELITFTLESDQDAADLNIDSRITTKTGHHYDAGLKSHLDLSANTSEKLIELNWFFISQDEQDVNNNVTGQGDIEYKPELISFVHQSNAPYASTLQGTVLLDDDTTLNLDLNWQDITLTLNTEQSFASERGAIHIEGPLASLTMTANARIDTAPVGTLDIDLDAAWSESVLTVKTLDIDVLDGKVEMNGVVNLEDGSKGHFELDARRLNFGKINSDLESQLMISSAINFTDTKAGLSSQLNISSIAGQWRGFPVKGAGELAYAKDSIQVVRLHLESGNNSLDLNLNMGESLQGLLDLSIQDLSVFSSDLAGNMQGRLDISGRPQTPRIEGKLTGGKIYISDVRLTSFVADAEIDLRPQQHSSLLLQLNALSYQNTIIDKVSISGEGLTEAHNIELTALSSGLELDSSISGGLKDKRWSGQLNQLELLNKEFGEWQLSTPANVHWQIEDKTFTLSETCLAQKEAYLCVSGANDIQQALTADIKLKQLPLKFAKLWLPETMSLNGDMTGNVSFNNQNQQWQLNALLEGHETQVVLGFEENSELLNLETMVLKASADQSHRDVTVNITAPDYFDLSLVGATTNAIDPSLQLDLNINIKQLDWLEKLEPTLSGSRGRFQATMSATGTLAKPKVKGHFSLQAGQLTVLPLGLNLDVIKGDIKSGVASRQIQLNTILGSQDKQLLIQGHASMDAENGYPYALDVTGIDFPLVRTADITLDVSPEINLSGTKKLHYSKGKLTVPLLELILTSVPEGAVSVSPDVLVIQSKEVGAAHIESGDAGNDFVKNHMDIDVDVILKPEIHIKAFGLDTRLLGDINIEKPVGLYQPRAEGQVTVKEGSYRAYGQNLKIGQGRLQFAGPIDNPALSIRAYRPGLEVKAGVNVTGNARTPKLTLFSEPSQTEADTLSYIITGRPISGASGGEASLIAQAAFSLGSEQSSVLANQIRDMFHLDEFTVGGGDSVDSTSLSASKRLSPKITFRSSFNPFDQLWSFLLNYELTDNWSVQTESGVTQGADIIYSIESNSFRDLYDRFWDVIKF